MGRNELKNLNVEEFKYLGAIIHENRSSQSDVEKLIWEGRTPTDTLNLFLLSRNILPKSKSVTYSATEQNIISYYFETETLNIYLTKYAFSVKWVFGEEYQEPQGWKK